MYKLLMNQYGVKMAAKIEKYHLAIGNALVNNDSKGEI